MARKGFLKDKCGPQAKTFEHHCHKIGAFGRLPEDDDVIQMWTKDEWTYSHHVNIKKKSDIQNLKLVFLFESARLSIYKTTPTHNFKSLIKTKKAIQIKKSDFFYFSKRNKWGVWINEQIFNRKSISRNTMHRQSYIIIKESLFLSTLAENYFLCYLIG